MNWGRQELNDLIQIVRHSSRPAREIVNDYFNDVGWSLLKEEYNKLSDEEKEALIKKLEEQRNG